MCSNFQQLTHLNTIYDLFEKEGIEKVFHAGDVIEGINMRKGHEFEIFKHGADAQTMYVVENYPYRKSISTDFILGNHDSTAIKEAGHNIGITLDRQRPDMNYLGVLNARVSLTPNCVVELNHPLDGMAYALSYPIQKSIESMIQMDVDDRPQIFLNGHHHKAIYVYTYGVHALECGTFQSRTAWMKGKRIPAMMGGYIVTVHVNSDGSVSRFIPEFIPAGKTIINDY
jgi:predicted phosphodiesterase